MQNVHVVSLQKQIDPVRTQLLQHPLYAAIHSASNLQTFMESHVFAVWDFMSLLKSLQQQLTCTTTPWFPVGSPNTRFLINEIVVGEESDVDSQGNRMSHFELYLKAMQEAGADTTPMRTFLHALQEKGDLKLAFDAAQISAAVRSFVDLTFEVIATQKKHILAAVFTFGREDLIPQMFIEMVDKMSTTSAANFSAFKYYLERHIEVDGDHHSHLALEMTTELCGDDPIKWEEATYYVKKSLQSRIQLWDAILESLSVK